MARHGRFEVSFERDEFGVDSLCEGSAIRRPGGRATVGAVRVHQTMMEGIEAWDKRKTSHGAPPR